MLKLLVPDLPSADKLLPWLEQIDASRWYANFGPLSQLFEARVREDLIANHGGGEGLRVVSTSTGTSALELSLEAYQLPRGSRVIVPALTFPATALAVLNCGHEPIIADVDSTSYALSIENVARLVDKYNAKAVIPVSVFGSSLDVKQWSDFATASGCKVLFDSAGAFGEQDVSDGIDVVYSFHATKALGIGEGGAVATFDSDFAERIYRLSNFGFKDGEIILQGGRNAKLSEYHAAVGMAQFERWPEKKKSRARLRGCYLDEFQGSEQILKAAPNETIAAPTLMVVELLDMEAKVVSKALAAVGVESRQWYCPPLYRHPAFRSYSLKNEAYPNTERLCGRLLGLPFHTFMDSVDVAKVVKEIKLLSIR